MPHESGIAAIAILLRHHANIKQVQHDVDLLVRSPIHGTQLVQEGVHNTGPFVERRGVAGRILVTDGGGRVNRGVNRRGGGGSCS